VPSCHAPHMKISLIIIAAVTAAQARIERLHQQDVAATLSGKADDLAALWDNDAVRIQPSPKVMAFPEKDDSAAPMTHPSK
jgi:hypothetical protein